MFVFFCCPSEESERALLMRVASDYTAMFFAFPDVDKDAFFEALPGLLSQVVITAFGEVWPKSAEKFGRAFQTEVSDMIEEWLAGTISYAPLFERWRQGELAAAAAATSAAAGAGAAGGAQRSRRNPGGKAAGRPDREQLRFLRDLGLGGGPAAGAGSNPVGPGPAVRRVPFDINGVSPMVAFFMHIHGASARLRRRMHVHRSERERNTVPAGQPTFYQVVMASATSSKARGAAYGVRCEESQRERNRLSAELAAHLREESGRVAKLMRRPHLVGLTCLSAQCSLICS